MSTTAQLIGSRYTLGVSIAELATGTLHEATDHKDGIAVQILRVRSESPEARRQARIVGLRLGNVRHRNLPRIYDLVEEGEELFSVQEQFQGDPLRQLARPVPVEVVARYLEQILSALAYLHSHEPPLCHRDLKPDCVLVAPHGTIQILGIDLVPTSLSGTGSAGEDVRAAGEIARFLLGGKVEGELEELLQALLAADASQRPSAQQVLDEWFYHDPAVRRRLPEFLLDSPSEEQPIQLPRTMGRFSQPSRPVKQSMWHLLFGKPGRRQPTSAPQETGPLVEMARQKFPLADLGELELSLETAQLLPEIAARCIQGVCIGLTSSDEMIVAAKDPSLVYIYDHVIYATQGRYRAILRRADPTLIDRALEWAYRNRTGASWRSWLQRRALDQVSLVVANPMADVSGLGDEISHPIIESTERMIKEALAIGTSDIHMEAFENRIEVRFRIDGVLQPAGTYAPAQGTAMIKRIKVMGNMDIAQERVTQGGRISLSVGDKRYDLRVSIVPVAYGESVVMRVLKKGSFNLTLSDLGMGAALEKRFRAALSQPHGIILVCGPTGSGKSTTLYASLKELQRPDRKILTVEDPVEYGMDGLVQVQVNLAPRDEEQKVTFAKVLREFLRQDPEVILVGEIRDPETASIALQASLTGHLVLSTLHTNDSVGIVSRLRDMAIKSYLVASTLRCGLSQRLARRICPSCREEIPITSEVVAEMEREGIAGPYRQFRGRGCRECFDTGYRGRLGIYEIMEVSAVTRSLIAREASDEELLAQLRREGFRSLYQSALQMVIDGLVSFEEVQRVCESGSI